MEANLNQQNDCIMEANLNQQNDCIMEANLNQQSDCISELIQDGNEPINVSKNSERNEKFKEDAETIICKKWFRLYWVFFLALCILLIESFFKSGIALGTVLWFTLAEGVAISFAKYSTGKLNKKALLLCIPIGLINLSHLLFYSISIQIITWPTALALFALQLTYLSKPEKVKFLDLFDIKNENDILNTVFVNPFAYIPYPFKGLMKFTNENNKSAVRNVLIGLIISIPIAGIFVGLFSSADRFFAEYAVKLAKNLFSNFGVLIADIIIGAIMCVFASSLFVGVNSRETAPGSMKSVKEVNNISLGTILTMVAIVVAAYVAIQFNHWFGNIPPDYYQMDVYSVSARGGFFELVAASCLLFALIATVTMVSAKRNNKLVPLIKAPLLLLCACNLIVLYSAVEKMAIYVNRSGITSSRVLVLWFIAVIVACMAGLIIKIMLFSFKAFNFCCVAAVALVCAIGFFDMDYHVAKNHIYLAEHHMIQNHEADMLSRLSYAAAKPVAEYKNRLENGKSAFESTIKQEKSEVIRILNHELERHQNSISYLEKVKPAMGFNFSRLNAQNAINARIEK
jgi:hypothetical protein